MRVTGYDPFRFDPPQPEPVEGPLPPPIALVDDEAPPAPPRWRFWFAAALLALLGLDLAARLLSMLLDPVRSEQLRPAPAPAGP